jgi:hypothetical protein
MNKKSSAHKGMSLPNTSFITEEKDLISELESFTPRGLLF